MSGASLVFNGVTKVYESPQGAVGAINDFNLAVSPGSFVAIVGPSGCGKSTVLQIAGGLMEATGGEVSLNEVVVKGPPPDAVYLFQNYAKSVFPWKTVVQNVEFGLRYRRFSEGRCSSAEISKRCEDMIDVVGLGAFKHYYPHQLSGGMQQRVAIARALVCRPNVLLMDEPFSAVDALTRSDLQDTLLKLWRQFRPTIVFVTHDIDEAIYLAERVVVLSRRPARVSRLVEISVPYPRDQIETRENPLVLQCRRTILADITARPASVGGNA